MMGGPSMRFRQDHVYLDDDLTRQQQAGRRALGDRQAGVAAGWPQDMVEA